MDLTTPDGTENEYQPESTEQYEQTDTDVEDEEKLALPKKKKAKVQVREAIKAAGKEMRDTKTPHTVVNCEAGHGTKTQATRLVFPFLSKLLTMLTLQLSVTMLNRQCWV